MAAPLLAPMPRELDIDAGYIIRVTAVDPATGLVVAGVRVSNIVITALNVTGGAPTDLLTGDWVLVPGPE